MGTGAQPSGQSTSERLLQMVAEAFAEQASYYNRREHQDREKRFNTGKVIPKITAADAQTTLDEFTAFEEEFVKTSPGNSKAWLAMLNDALVGEAKTWKNFVIVTEPGKSL